MNKISLLVPDGIRTLLEELARAIPGMEITEIKEVRSTDVFRHQPPLTRLYFAVREIAREGVLRHQYDYAWLYQVIQENQLKGIERFQSVRSFLLLLSAIGVEKIPSNSTISDRLANLRHRYPDWVFSDGSDAVETQRRNNVARRFLCLYIKGK